MDTRSTLEDLRRRALRRTAASRCPRPTSSWRAGSATSTGRTPGSSSKSDSYAYHRSPGALADDRERDVSLTLAGIRSLRFTGEQLRSRPRYVADAIAAALQGADSTA